MIHILKNDLLTNISYTIVNISQEINTANMTTSFLALIQISNIIENYIIRFISITGMILNFISLAILLNKDLNHFIYNYIWSRFFCNLIVCATGAGYVKPCTTNCSQTYFEQLTNGQVFQNFEILNSKKV